MKKILIFFSLLLVSINCFCENGRDSLFSITPDQMVFAAKLSDNNRRIYCHKFSMKQRQHALDEWKVKQSDNSDHVVFSPDDCVRMVAEMIKSVEDDLLFDSNKVR